MKRVNLGAGEQVDIGHGTVVRFDGAVPFINLQVSHDPGRCGCWCSPPR
ncbi:conserved transmembrane domain protein [Mycobacterium xenopi 4042]|uniref:Conserved transmembrane domain protein n=1 Tax=Mycobacterium xenopi 4042 TaxID=1299334 RepID=X8CAF9_MYCXE|nr:conserved transmembrane domain protein [Mycobacterium xenopi 4042]